MTDSHPWFRASPATIVLASIIAIPLFPSNFILLYGLAYPLHWSGDIPLSVCVAVAGLLGAELFSVLLISRAIERWLARNDKTSLLRLRFGTTLAIMLVCAVLLFLSFSTLPENGTAGQIYFVGWPFWSQSSTALARSAESRVLFTASLTANLLIWIITLVATVVVCEKFWRWQDRCHVKLPLPANESRTRLVPPAEVTLSSLVPTWQERWLYAFPVFLLLTLVPLSIWLPEGTAVIIKNFNLESTRLFPLSIATRNYLLALPFVVNLFGMFAVILTYFLWACRERKRMILFSMICLLGFVLGLFTLCLAVVLPLLQFPSCVRRGTRIATPDGARMAEDLKPSDSIICLDAEGKQHAGKVTAIIPGYTESFLDITLEGGMELQVTQEHPIALNACWLRARALSIGDSVLTVEGLRRVEKIAVHAETSEVFDLTVEPYHNFFANDVLVHNALKRK